MNWLDGVILIVIGIAVFLGLKAGLIKGILSLAGLIGGIILAGHYYIPLSKQLSFIPQTKIAEAVAFIIILIGVMVIASVLAGLLGRVASALTLGWLNHLGGAILGLMLGTILCAALLVIYSKFFGSAGVISQSSLAAILLDHFPAILALLPDEFDVVRSFFQ